MDPSRGLFNVRKQVRLLPGDDRILQLFGLLVVSYPRAGDNLAAQRECTNMFST